MKRIIYGVLVVALSFAFLTGCDDSRKKLAGEEPLVCDDLNGNSVCDIDEPPPPDPIALTCYDMTVIPDSSLLASKEEILRLHPIIKTRKISDLIATRPVVGRHFETAVATKIPKKPVDSVSLERIRILEAKIDILESFEGVYNSDLAGTFYMEVYDPDAEYSFEIGEKVSKGDLFAPEGKCFFVADDPITCDDGSADGCVE